MAPGTRNKFGAPMFEPKVFWEQMRCIEGSTRDIVGTFQRPLVIRRPGHCAPPPLYPPLRPCSQVYSSKTWRPCAMLYTALPPLLNHDEPSQQVTQPFLPNQHTAERETYLSRETSCIRFLQRVSDFVTFRRENVTNIPLGAFLST